MDGTSWDKRRHLEGTDVISNLPSEIIDYILKYLPFRDAARTSILSREWRFKWFNVPNLVFDRNIGNNHDVEAIINRVFFNHKWPIDKFIIDNSSLTRHHTVITNWIRYLANYQIREFTLRSYMGERFLIPFDLFTFKNLTHLTLRACKFKPSCDLKGFALLVHLNLINVSIVPHELCSFISKCPLLEYLGLLRCTFRMLGAFVINAPRLKTFHFCRHFGPISSISLKHTSLIEELFLELSYFDLEELITLITNDRLMNRLSQLSSLTRLTLNGRAVQFLIADGVPEKLPHNHLKLLNLPNISFNDTLQVKFVVCLLRSSPNLERLSITPIKDGDEDSMQFLTSQERRNISLNHLKEVYIEDFKGLAPEMEFVKLVLASAAELEIVKVIWHIYTYISTDSTSRIEKEFARFLLPSFKTKISFVAPLL